MKFRRSKKMYEMYVCPRCFNQVNKCTCKEYPPWSLVMIDKKIQPHIRLLNQKGYATTYCCEGHEREEAIYISFQLPLDMMFEEIPEGFKTHAGKSIQKKIPRDCEDVEQFKDDVLSKLYEWIENLPEWRYSNPNYKK